MGTGNWPDFSLFLTECWGYPSFEGCAPWSFLGGATNVVVGTNPPYYLTDFFSFFPKYAGPVISISGAFTSGLALVTSLDATQLKPGMYVSDGMGNTLIPPGTFIAAITAIGNGSNGEITLSNPVLLTGTYPFTVYVGPPLVPVPVINAYIALASASLVQARWFDTWAFAIALYVAHFLTLYLRSEGNCSTTCGQAAVAGLKQGITVGMSAGGVSQNLQPTPGMDDWGAFNQTQYGVQLVTFGQSIGSGPLFCQ